MNPMQAPNVGPAGRDFGVQKEFSFRGFSGSCVEDEHNGETFYHGKILDIEPLVLYEASDKQELYREFKLAVREYVNYLKTNEQ